MPRCDNSSKCCSENIADGFTLSLVSLSGSSNWTRWCAGTAMVCRYWRWKSRNPRGRPPIDMELRALIRQMNLENVLWGAPRIQGELLKLGFTVAQLTVAKYMVRRQSSPSGQNWKTFLRNHVPYTAVIDLFVVPTITFAQLYALVIVHLARRELVWINVTGYPTAVWIAQQITEAFPWVEVPRYLIRDRDAVYGEKVLRRIHSMELANSFRRCTKPRKR
jgi:hypothetical protein